MIRPLSRSISTVAAVTLISFAAHSRGAEVSDTGSKDKALSGPERVRQPKLHTASDEPGKAMAKFTVPEGFKVDLWAAEPLLGNPVAFSIDEQGRVFVAETYRYRSSTLDIRHYMFMLEDDLAARTTDDRIAMSKKHFPKEWQKLELETEVVRLVEDKKGSGKADSSSEYAAGMSTILDGINSGVLAHYGKVWCTNMPNLWLFSGVTAEGKAEKRESLSSGYGVRFSYTGHDMHGLQLGPDGRLYFSFGDRGAHVKTKEGKTLAFSDEGGVFRCEPDGSHMEAIARGLRNPQELAFDNHGNLFTGDNDADVGDRERWEYVVEGGDYGWRIGWQHNPLGNQRNPWMAQKMWQPRTEGTPAHLLSPITLLPDGPSGVVHYPGTGLPAEFEDHFFVCGFKGSSARSAISTLKVKENGAGFIAIKEPATFVDHVQATDVDFGPDSQIYFSDWGEGWEGSGRGRIFKMGHTAALSAQAAQVAEVKKLLGEGFQQRSGEELAKLLAHPDQRIRLNAQWALAAKADGAEKLLAAVNSGAPLARLHGIWGVGHIARLAGYKDQAASTTLLTPLLALLNDQDPEVRAQSAKVLGEGAVAASFEPLVKALKDENLRVRFFAAQSLGKLSNPAAAEALIALLRDNADKDEFIRNAGVVALVRTGNQAAIAAAAKDPSRAVRLAALLALRRTNDPRVAQFLADPEPQLVKEAAQAINDEGITAAYGDLAKLITEPGKDEQLLIRAINANFRAGTPETARALAGFAAGDAAEALRIEALQLLSTWPKPFNRDRVAGVYRPIGERDGAPAVAAIREALPKLLASKSANAVVEAIKTVAALNMKDAGTALYTLVTQKETPTKARIEALKTLAAFDDATLADAIRIAFKDNDPALRVEASAMLAKLNPDEAAEQLASVLGSSGTVEKKSIITALGNIKSANADKAILALVEDLIRKQVPGEVQLEVLEAAAKRNSEPLKAKLAAYTAGLPKENPLAAFEPTLLGGDKAAG
ncbi:MAG: HEAT repeat domain-containing protein, partial [Verrucomicrobiota bacterium]